MEKIQAVIQSLVNNPNKISQVERSSDELYFLVDQKYKFSIIKSDGEDIYYLHFYSDNSMSIEQLIRGVDWSNYHEYVTFNSRELNEFELFDNLYKKVKNKLFNIDSVFDEILKVD
ncbi:hypothetical protein [Sphingobacterium sp.]|uniref:hypothetical protein n=1 Tax=Sphingobacterium sp. TaxID=341027 RepID=UPI002FDD9D54